MIQPGGLDFNNVLLQTDSIRYTTVCSLVTVHSGEEGRLFQSSLEKIIRNQAAGIPALQMMRYGIGGWQQLLCLKQLESITRSHSLC